MSEKLEFGPDMSKAEKSTDDALANLGDTTKSKDPIGDYQKGIKESLANKRKEREKTLKEGVQLEDEENIENSREETKKVKEDYIAESIKITEPLGRNDTGDVDFDEKGFTENIGIKKETKESKGIPRERIETSAAEKMKKEREEAEKVLGKDSKTETTDDKEKDLEENTDKKVKQNAIGLKVAADAFKKNAERADENLRINKKRKTRPQTEEDIFSTSYATSKKKYEEMADKNSKKGQKVKDRMDSDGVKLREHQEQETKKANSFDGEEEAIHAGWKKENKKTGSEPKFAGFAGENKEGSKTDQESGYQESVSAKALKEESDELFQRVLEAKGNLQKNQNKRGVITKLSGIFGMERTKDFAANNELRDTQKAFEKAQADYRAKYNEFSRQIREDKKNSLGLGQKESSDELINFMMTEAFIKRPGKNEANEDIVENITIFEDMRRNEKELLVKRTEILSDKKKGNLKTLLDKYNNLPKKGKMALGVGLSMGIGTIAMATGGATISAAVGYGIWKGGKTLLRKLVMGAALGATVKTTDNVLSSHYKKENEKDKEKAIEKMASDFEKKDNDIFEALSVYNKKEKSRETRKRVFVGGAVLALFGTALGAEALLAGELPGGSIDHKDIIPPKPGANMDNLLATKENIDGQDALEEMKGATVGDVDGHATMADKINKDKHFSEKVDTRIADKIDEDKRFESKYGMLNKDFELRKGGNVWSSLSDHFEGNKREVGNVLLGFKSDVAKDLITEHGMSPAQADKFIEWRYGHMNAGTDFNLQDGKLDIPGFADDKMIDRFQADNLATMEKPVGITRPESVAMNNIIDSEESVAGPVDGAEVDLDLEEDAMSEVAINNWVDKIVNERIAKIYESWGLDQIEEWDVMKDKMASDILNEQYGEPIGNQIDQAEINNRKELRGYLNELMQQDLDKKNEWFNPRKDETVGAFVKRAEEHRYRSEKGIL